MATTKSAEKRNRQNQVRRERNRQARAALRTVIRSAQQLATEGNQAEAKEKARVATRMLDKAVVHGLLHKNTAQRTISRLNKRVSQTVAAKA